MELSQFIDFSDYWSVSKFILFTFFIIFLRYVFISVIFIVVFEILLKEKYVQRKISKSLKQPTQRKKEILWSILTSFIFSVSGTAMIYLYSINKTSLYLTFSIHDIWYIPLSFCIALLLHETYYYFLHRFMHHPKVFKHFHKIHHDSIVTSAWTAFSFHPYESILQAVIIPIVVIWLPLHVYVLLFLLILMSISATINHLDIEIYPKWMLKTGIGKWLIGASHHSLHHRYYTKNYGLYFTFYDRWLKTESDDFETLLHKKIYAGSERSNSSTTS